MNISEIQKEQMHHWTRNLQGRILQAFENLEKEAAEGPFSTALGREPSVFPRFEKTLWQRPNVEEAEGGGGLTAILRGNIFEKAGVQASTVYGTFPEDFARSIPGAEQDPRFWASGISVIAHPRNPHLPSIHMNTRLVITTRQWIGGGIDLSPMLEIRRRPETPAVKSFHTTMQALCDRHQPEISYEKCKQWCDEYFFLKHRKESRGVGGIFYDYHNSGDISKDPGGPAGIAHPLSLEASWEKDFKFTQDVGETFLSFYVALIGEDYTLPWTETERAEQLKWRGRYVEFNLLYDRGTLFGLRTGGNVESILSSLPPVAIWP